MLGRDYPGGINATAGRLAPLADWTHRQVRHYLDRQRITLPSISDGSNMFGLALTPKSLAWLRQQYPGDYRRILEVFPYAEAHADRYQPRARHSTQRHRTGGVQSAGIVGKR